MKAATQHRIRLSGRQIDYWLVSSSGAKKLHVRVGLNGVEVVRPRERSKSAVSAFLRHNQDWLLAEVDRADRLRGLRLAGRAAADGILFRGVRTPVVFASSDAKTRGNAVDHLDGRIVIRRGPRSRTPAARSLENWLRKQARVEIERQLATVTARLRQRPGRIYVMGQRTKWGNCSAQRNLSFNWRLILAPEFVLRYIVTHEVTHLAIPDHSVRFWLTVQSRCPETERARQWLCRNQAQLTVDLNCVVDLEPAREEWGGRHWSMSKQAPFWSEDNVQ